MAELNKVPGLFPSRMAASASTSVLLPSACSFAFTVCCTSVVTGTVSTATPGASAVRGSPGSPQEELGTFFPASHTLPLPGGGTPQPNSRGRARGQVQPGPQKPLLWGIRWASRSRLTALLRCKVAFRVGANKQPFLKMYFQPRRRSFNGARAIPHVVRPVDDVTEAELRNICNNVREKVYNSSTVSPGLSALQRHVRFSLKSLFLIYIHMSREALATSAARKQLTPRPTVVTPSALEFGVSSAAPASATVMERRSKTLCWIRWGYCRSLMSCVGVTIAADACGFTHQEWRCPPCRGICNCSFCRARDGRCATGVLVYLAKYHGYDNVHAYLNKCVGIGEIQS